MNTKRIFFVLSAFVFFQQGIAQTTIVLQPGPEGKDAWLNTYYTQNYGDYPNLFASAWTHSGMPFVTRSVFDFDLSEIPANAVILDARLNLFFAINANNPGYYQTSDNQAFLKKITAPWDEHMVTW